MKRMNDFLVISIWEHDEWSGCEVVRDISFDLRDMELAQEYRKLFHEAVRDMEESYYLEASGPHVRSGEGIVLPDHVEVGYTGQMYYDHLKRYLDGREKFRFPKEKY